MPGSASVDPHRWLYNVPRVPSLSVHHQLGNVVLHIVLLLPYFLSIALHHFSEKYIPGFFSGYPHRSLNIDPKVPSFSGHHQLGNVVSHTVLLRQFSPCRVFHRLSEEYTPGFVSGNLHRSLNNDSKIPNL